MERNLFGGGLDEEEEILEAKASIFIPTSSSQKVKLPIIIGKSSLSDLKGKGPLQTVISPDFVLQTKFSLEIVDLSSPGDIDPLKGKSGTLVEEDLLTPPGFSEAQSQKNLIEKYIEEIGVETLLEMLAPESWEEPRKYEVKLTNVVGQ